MFLDKVRLSLDHESVYVPSLLLRVGRQVCSAVVLQAFARGISGILAVLIPVFNGVVTGAWFWKTFANQQYYIFSVDFAWFLAGSFGLIIYLNLKRKVAIKQEVLAPN